MADLRKLKDKAAEHLSRGRFAKAAEALAEVVKADPRDVGARQKLADALRRSGDGPGALRVYQEVADWYARDGQLIKAVAILKIVLEIDPQHAETQEKLADLYARKQGVGLSRRGLTPPAPGPAAAEPERGVAIPLAPIGGGREIEFTPDDVAGAPVDPGTALRPSAEREVELPLDPDLPPAAEEATPAAPRPVPVLERLAPPHLSSAATPFEAILGAARAAAGPEEEVLILVEGGDEPLDSGLEGVPLLLEVEAEAGAAAEAAAEDPLPAGPAPTAASSAGPARPLPTLPRVPLFSDLPHDAFVALTERVVLHQVPAGAVVLEEGAVGTSFFVLASGALRVEKAAPPGPPVPLARLGEGAFVGEMAILSGEPRAATVVAEEPSDLLEIRADVLLGLAAEHPRLIESLARFYRRRLLANAMATSPLFRPFTREDRAEVMGRFRTREVPAGTAVITEGLPSDGLYVVLSGGLEVWKRRGEGEALAARLGEGDVFGEMSCLRKGPATATVRTVRRAVLLRLPRADFQELVLTYPQILELVSELTDQRQHGLEELAAGRVDPSAGGPVLL